MSLGNKIRDPKFPSRYDSVVLRLRDTGTKTKTSSHRRRGPVSPGLSLLDLHPFRPETRVVPKFNECTTANRSLIGSVTTDGDVVAEGRYVTRHVRHTRTGEPPTDLPSTPLETEAFPRTRNRSVPPWTGGTCDTHIYENLASQLPVHTVRTTDNFLNRTVEEKDKERGRQGS